MGRTKAITRRFIISGRALMRLWDKDPHRECIPASEVAVLTATVHERLGHAGRDTMLVALSLAYFWPNITVSAVKAIEGCE